MPVERSLAGGGMSVAWRARDEAFAPQPAGRFPPRNVFLKLLLATDLSSEDARNRFREEARYLNTIEHRNVVNYVGYGNPVLDAADAERLYPDPDHDPFPPGPMTVPYLATEHLNGYTFAEFVSQWRSETGSALGCRLARLIHLLCQACRGVEALHAAGLLHRDISPKNLMVCDWRGEPDVVKVLDLGLAQPGPRYRRLIERNVPEGTIAYLAPECFPRERQVLVPPDPEPQTNWELVSDVRSEVYALGCVAFHMLTGVPPFGSRQQFSVEQLYQNHLNAPRRRPREVDPTVPSGFDEPIRRALAPNPAGRYQTVAEFRAALSAVPLVGAWTDADARAWWDAHAG